MIKGAINKLIGLAVTVIIVFVGGLIIANYPNTIGDWIKGVISGGGAIFHKVFGGDPKLPKDQSMYYPNIIIAAFRSCLAAIGR